MSDELQRSVKYGTSSGRNSFIKVDGSGLRAQDLDGADVIVRLSILSCLLVM